MIRAYSDGGLLGINPNPKGGTYAWVLVNHPEETIHSEGSGIIAADVLGCNGFVTNQTSELYALCAAVLKTPEGEEVHYYSDSQNALERVFARTGMANVPAWLKIMRNNANAHLAKVCLKGYTLLAGHPNKTQLQQGWHCDVVATQGKNKGKMVKGKNLPVSAWNVYCDSKCNEARANWEAENS